MGSSLAWDECWKWILATSTGSGFAVMGLRNSKQGDKLSSTLTPAMPHWPPSPLIRWPGLGHHQLLCCADKSSERTRTDCAKGHSTIISVYTVLLSNSYVINTVPAVRIKLTVLYTASEKALLSCTGCFQHTRDLCLQVQITVQQVCFAELTFNYLPYIFQVKFRAKFRTSVWTECHMTLVYIYCTTCHTNL